MASSCTNVVRAILCPHDTCEHLWHMARNGSVCDTDNLFYYFVVSNSSCICGHTSGACIFVCSHAARDDAEQMLHFVAVKRCDPTLNVLGGNVSRNECVAQCGAWRKVHANERRRASVATDGNR